MSDTYSQIFAAEDKAARAKALEKYNFTCACAACSEDWQKLPKLRSKLSGMPAGNYLSEPTKTRLSRVKSLEAAAAKLRGSSSMENVLSAEVELMRELQSLLRPPHQMLLRAEDRVYKALLAAHGTTDREKVF